MRAALLWPAMLATILASCQQLDDFAQDNLRVDTKTQQDPVQLSRTLAPSVESAFGGVYNHRVLSAYMARIAEKIMANETTPDLAVNVSIVDTPLVNATSLPGGQIYLTRGLLALATSEAEIAGALAYHIAHIAAGDGIARGIFAVDAKLIGASAEFPPELAVLAYDERLVTAADERAIDLMARAGYDPLGLHMFVETIKAQSERNADGPSVNGGWRDRWLRHAPRRLDHLARLTDTVIAEQGGTRLINANTYLNAIDDLDFGASPASGTIIGHRFVDPVRRFEFSVPQSLKLNIDGNKVSAVTDRTLRMRFEVGDAAAVDLTGHLQNSMTKNLNLTSFEPIALDDRQAMAGYAKAKVGGKELELMAVAADGPETRVYEFLFVSEVSISEADRLQNLQTLKSLREFSVAEAAGLKFPRLDIQQLESGQTADAFVTRMAADGDKRDLFDHLNGLNRGRSLDQLDQVKIVIE